jgi:hypothetical protein
MTFSLMTIEQTMVSQLTPLANDWPNEDFHLFKLIFLVIISTQLFHENLLPISPPAGPPSTTSSP